MTNFLATPLTSGASTPAVAGMAPGTNTVDLRVRCSRLNWADTLNLGAYISNWSSTAANCRYMLSAGSGGTLIAQWYNASGALQTCTSTVATGLAAGSIKWVRALINPGAGTCSFYLSDDDITYTQLGTTITGKTTTAVQTPTTAQPMRVGLDGSGTNGMVMHVYAHRVLINAVSLENMNWTSQTAVTGTWTASTGEVYSAVGSATINTEDGATTTVTVSSSNSSSKTTDLGTTSFVINATAAGGTSSPPLDTTSYVDCIDAGNVRANRMIDALPPFYRNDPTVRRYVCVCAKELDRIEAAADALRTGSFPLTATERTLEYYERLFQLSATGLSIAQRQNDVAGHFRKRRVAERYDWAQALGAFIGSPDWSYSEGPHDTYTVNLTTPTDPTGIRTALITSFARAITPAHLQLVVNGAYGGFLVGISRVGVDPI